MPRLRRRSGSWVPAEFSFFDEKQWLLFNGLVQRSLRGHPSRVVAPGFLEVGDPPQPLALHDLAEQCRAYKKADWPHIVRRYFESALDPGDEIVAEKLAGQLRVRLLPDDLDPSIESLNQPFAQSVVAMLVADLPSAIRGMSMSDLEKGGIPMDVAWELAWENTRRFEAVNDSVEVLGGMRYHSVLDASFYTASKVRWLPEIIGDIGPAGALVVIPRRHTIVAHKIEHMHALQATHQMIDTARQLFLDGPGSISRHLYWWRDGELTWLPAYYQHRRIEFHPPEAFSDVISQLPG